MVQLAMKDFFPKDFPVHINKIEIENGESIPTMYLMDKLNELYDRTHDFHFIMGSDLIKTLNWWDDGERIIETMPTIIFLRKGYDNEAILQHANFPKNDPIVI